jgi:ATP-dependent Lhr-like helicase
VSRRPEADALDAFLPPIAAWFRAAHGVPTPPQRLGWPAIAAGRSTLICAPTGSGKTLAAFLACLDHLWRVPRARPGVRVLYVSPLKALNEDIARNLQRPLSGVLAAAEEGGYPLEPLSVAVRTGDTPPAQRQRLVRKPPDILITTPESLHLLLTSRARETLRNVSHVLVDEIHALAPNKRGVFLALLLERLEAINPASFVRVGLSATQRPLEEVGRYLGGLRKVGPHRHEPRPVTIIDAGRRKELDLKVELPARDGPGGSIWPAIEGRLRSLIEEHRSTIVFVNNRRVAERLTAQLNSESGIRNAESEDPPDGTATEPESTIPDSGFRIPDSSVAAHHGSLSPPRRRAIEEALKAGGLRAVVATASLELGIDMGAVDLVCQVESPGGIARGLQRVGRAGHLVGATSKGRILAKTSIDLLESAALAREMAAGIVEELKVPANCLDVLAQQVVACVAMDRWRVPELLDVVRGAYPYRGLTAAAFEAVLELVSGRYHVEVFRDLRPRVSWDRVHNRLHPLPGTAQRALVGGGAIPDTGQFPLYLGENGPRLGELDEEFVLERRVGETFVLGSSAWRIEQIDPQRVVVSPAEGRPALMPFWRGEGAHRTAELGEAVGRLCRELTERLDDPGVLDWLRAECHLDEPSARSLHGLVARQVRLSGVVPDDRTVLVEAFRDPAGEVGLAVLTPYGGRLHHALKLVLQAALRRRLGITVACLHGDDGVLIRVPGSDEPPLDVLRDLTADRAERYLLEELPDSALFGLRFRQNAGRALLLPRPDPSKRTPLWLQRLRAKDLLQAVRQMPDFPIVAETFRECLESDLDLPRLRALLDRIATGEVRVIERRGEIASPFTSGLIFAFSLNYLYEWDEPKRVDGSRRGPEADPGLLDALRDPASYAAWLDPEAIGRVEGRLRGAGRPPRSADEMAERLRVVGDLAPSELSGPMAAFLDELEAAGRVTTIELVGTKEPRRWVLTEERRDYEQAFGVTPKELAIAHDDASVRDSGPLPPGGGGLGRGGRERARLPDRAGLRPPLPAAAQPPSPARGEGQTSQSQLAQAAQDDRPASEEEEKPLTAIIRRYLRTRALVTADELAARYPIDPLRASERMEEWAESGGLVRLDAEDGRARWADRHNLDDVRRLSIALRRRESVAVVPEVFAEFLARRHHLHPETRLEGTAAVPLVLGRLEGFAAAAELWEMILLPRRVRDYRPAWLDEALAVGGWAWRASGEAVALARRGFPWPAPGEPAPLGAAEAAVLDVLGRGGARFVDELAVACGLPPSRVRTALDSLARLGRVTNDRFDPLRPAARARLEALAGARPPSEASRGRLGRSPRPLALLVPEGRWSVFGDAGEPDDPRLAWAGCLLERFGVLCRETAALDAWAPPWRELAPVLAAAELRGELRRGYFVEGLSGVQYALPEAADELARLAAGPPADAPPVLMASLDPANLYGSGAPLDIPLLEGGTARLTRAAANELVLIGGRPVLIIEGHGRRLTGLASASEAELRSALALLPTLAGPSRRVLKVETYNLAPALASPAAPWLADLGFVRDPPGMAYYAGWS